MARAFRILAAAVAIGMATAGAAPVPAPIPAPNYPAAATSRDGSRDFDFEFGTWRTHYRLLRRRLVGDRVWYDCYGTSVIRPFWNGNGNLEDGDLRCPHRYVGGLTLRMYDARTHQWRLWWGTRALGIAPPPQAGHFDGHGVGRFYAYDTWNGTPIINRFRWTIVRGNPHFEQAFSVDGGKTWETNWTTDYVRVAPSTKGVWNAVNPPGDRAFAFLIGTWKTHSMRLRHPLANDRTWYACEGRSVVRSFWGGSGTLEDAAARCPIGEVREATVQLEDAATHRWMLYSATEKNGLSRGLPPSGRFSSNGTGDFFAPGTYAGRRIVVRDRWERRGGNPRFEQAYSADGGTTWQTNWTIDYTRISEASRT